MIFTMKSRIRAADFMLLCTFLPSCKAFVQSHYLEVPSSFTISAHNSLNTRKINPKSFTLSCQSDPKDVDICVIGGGISGLTAAITAADLGLKNKKEFSDSIILMEASETLGGRVQSDKTDDGYTLDRGFAVFIEKYPQSKVLLDYESLKLGKFSPGALIKLDGNVDLVRVTDPLRGGSLVDAIFTPVGSLLDKIRLFPLLINVLTKSVDEIFAEEEVDTMTLLKESYGFSDQFINQFFTPFLEGIYLCPLNEQSSRMFHFVFKMFSEGSATLPSGGMHSIIDQLAKKIQSHGIQVFTNKVVSKISVKDDGSITVTTDNGKTNISTKYLVLATDGNSAQKLLSSLKGFESLSTAPKHRQLAVGCLYYGFDTPVPINEPILILNGESRCPQKFPVNNVCFPSAVNSEYAPSGCGLCSVTILQTSLDVFRGNEEKLDAAVRNQLASWFPDYASDIKNKWELKRMYEIPNAQPSQWKGPAPASVHGGRDCTEFRGRKLPDGILICGDHHATATFNGALESGVNAGKAAATALIAK